MMSPRISLKRLTEKQRRVWLMRYRKRWRMTRIALELGMSQSGVTRMLQRARRRVGLPVRRAPVIRTKPRSVRVYLLSEVFERY
jgi:DNA-directed RNA polymerase specialized sigma24 family protein